MGLLSNVVGAVQSRLKRMMGVRTEQRKIGWVRWCIGGNMLLPQLIQEKIIAAAAQKRTRKMARPGGWYNG